MASPSDLLPRAAVAELSPADARLVLLAAESTARNCLEIPGRIYLDGMRPDITNEEAIRLGMAWTRIADAMRPIAEKGDA